MVQELIDQLQSSTSSQDGSDSDSDNLMMLSAAAVSNSVSKLSLTLPVLLQGIKLRFLVDSGSTHSFVDSSHQQMFPTMTEIKSFSVKVAGGGKLSYS